jgi:hypothetical protein
MKTYKKPKPRSPFNQLRKYLSPKEMRRFIKNSSLETHEFYVNGKLLLPHQIIAVAFAWLYTSQGYQYWHHIERRIMKATSK